MKNQVAMVKSHQSLSVKYVVSQFCSQCRDSVIRGMERISVLHASMTLMLISSVKRWEEIKQEEMGFWNK